MKYLPLFVLMMLISCSGNNNIDKKEYLQELEAWKQSRLERLKAENGWLNLVGLYWLQEGENRFGSDSSNQVIFPATAPGFCGMIVKDGDSIHFIQDNEGKIKVNEEIMQKAGLNTDATGNPTIMKYESLAWYIIKRDSLYGIRLRDHNSPRIEALDHIPSFEPGLEWRKVAEFVPYEHMDTVWVPTVTGQEEMYRVPGKVVFKHKGKKYELLPFLAGSGFFLIIGDKTSALETYPAGRFMYTEGPDSLNQVILDFNKAYNPPCAFTPYATCPLPPPENRLGLRITAGEKAVHLE